MMKASDSEVAASPVPHIESKGNKVAKNKMLEFITALGHYQVVQDVL